MKLKLKTINDVSTYYKPKLGAGNLLPYSGVKLFSDNRFSNIFLCAKKKSGKTTTILRVIKECVSKNSYVYVFSSTCMGDPTYHEIAEFCESKGAQYIPSLSTYEQQGNKKINLLENLINYLSEETEDIQDSSSDEDDRPINERLTDLILNRKKTKPRKPKKYYNPYIIILDDLGDELQKNSSISKLLKMNRHIKSMVLVSSQYWTDLPSDARQNLNFIFLFKNLTDVNLQNIYKYINLNISYEDFYKLYKHITNPPFSFMYINTDNQEIRQNFNKKLMYQDSDTETDDNEDDKDK